MMSLSPNPPESQLPSISTQATLCPTPEVISSWTPRMLITSSLPHSPLSSLYPSSRLLPKPKPCFPDYTSPHSMSQAFLPHLPLSHPGTWPLHPASLPPCLDLLISPLTSPVSQEQMLLHVPHALPISCSPSLHGLHLMFVWHFPKLYQANVRVLHSFLPSEESL